MNKPVDFLAFLSNLMDHGRDLHYNNRYGESIKVKLQPLMKLDKMNSEPGTVKLLTNLGVSDAIVIGNDEKGIAILLATKTLKTYLLDPGLSEPGQYLKNEITIIIK